MGDGPLNQKKELLGQMFGEEPADSVVSTYAKAVGVAVASGKRSVTPSGRVIPATPAAAVGTPGQRPRPHTFFGAKLR